MDWEYIAGFFDGEGNICYTRRPTAKVKKQVAITISQKHKEVLEQIQEFLLNHMVTHVGIYFQKNRWGGAYALRIDVPKDVAYFLSALYPLLVVKKEEAGAAHSYLCKDVLPFVRNYNA